MIAYFVFKSAMGLTTAIKSKIKRRKENRRKKKTTKN
jgi:hypothetical protein